MMKKYLLILICLFGINSIYAQDFSIGPKVGINRGNVMVTGNGFDSGSSRYGYHLGAFARLGGDFIYLQPELLFTQTGGEIVFLTSNGTNAEVDVSFNRVDVPLMLGLKWGNFFRVQAGPVASILINYNLDDSFQVAQNVNYNRATLGYQAGVGIDVGNIILDLKYESSLGKIANSVAGFSTDQRQNQLILSAGFRLF
jgi:hypothetical protein